jgi:hypothetical protein
MKMLAVLAALVATLCGCSSGGTKQAPTASPTPTPTPKTSFGASAPVLAASVPGCSGAKEVPLGGASPGLVSIASCTLLGKSVVFVTFTDQAGEDSGELLYTTAGAPESWYAVGPGYVASAETESGDLPGQKAVAVAVVAALGGTVKHHLK